jgi:hypothetical protein
MEIEENEDDVPFPDAPQPEPEIVSDPNGGEWLAVLFIVLFLASMFILVPWG